MAKGETYEEFVEKFKPKHTTDDCYTPPIVYDAIADWVAKTYGLDRANFVRPFYPGGEYQNFEYKDGDVVVDNPPFSIFSQICRWYIERGIRFFLFAPYLTMFNNADKLNYVVSGSDVTYENGANVKTSFVTNMGDVKLWACPELHNIIKAADDKNRKSTKKELPKYSYPNNVVTTTMLGYLASHNTELKISGNVYHIRALDSQRAQKKAIFGSGFLISDSAAAEKAAAEKAAAERAAAERAAAERAAAERAAANKWELSANELAIIASLK